MVSFVSWSLCAARSMQSLYQKAAMRCAELEQELAMSKIEGKRIYDKFATVKMQCDHVAELQQLRDENALLRKQVSRGWT